MSGLLDGSGTLRLSGSHVLREVAGERLVIPLAQDGLSRLRVYGVSEDGARLWRLLERGATREELAAALDEPDAAAAVGEFLEALRSLGALQEDA